MGSSRLLCYKRRAHKHCSAGHDICQKPRPEKPGPAAYLFLGFPVDGESIQNEFGFVMEDIEEQDGKLVRRFIGFTESLRQTIRGEKRIYTKNLRLYPEDYGDELDLYRKAGKVWISYGIPFIIPITAGYLAALLMGDILFVIITTLAGT